MSPDPHNISNDTVMNIIILTLKGSPTDLPLSGPGDNCQIQENKFLYFVDRASRYNSCQKPT